MHNDEKNTEDWVRKAYLDTPLANIDAKKRMLDAIRSEFTTNNEDSKAPIASQTSHKHTYNLPRLSGYLAVTTLSCAAIVWIVMFTNRGNSTDNNSLNNVYAESTGSGLASELSGNSSPKNSNTDDKLTLSQKQLSAGIANNDIHPHNSNVRNGTGDITNDIKDAADKNVNTATHSDIRRDTKDLIQEKQPSLATNKSDRQPPVEDGIHHRSQTEIAKPPTTNSISAFAQSLQKLDSKTARHLSHLVDSAQSLSLPTSALTLRIQEGIKRGAKSERIAVVANNYVAALSTSRSGLGHQATQDEIELGAEAVLAGASQAGLRELRAARPSGSMTEPLLALTDMASHGVPVKTAGSAIASVMSGGGTDISVRAFRTSVVGDIIKGVPPESALTKSLQKQQLPNQKIRKDQIRDSLKHKDVLRP